MSLPGHSAERMRRFYATVEPRRPRAALRCGLMAARRARRTASRWCLPTEPLARLVAGEWAAQGENILPETMPATRLAWGALALGDEGVRAGAVARIASFAESDLVCYFADRPCRAWWSARSAAGVRSSTGPRARWARRSTGPRASSTSRNRPRRSSGSPSRPPPQDDFGLAGLAAAAALFGSAILAFALRAAS